MEYCTNPAGGGGFGSIVGEEAVCRERDKLIAFTEIEPWREDLVKTARTLLVATYTDPVTAAQAIPQAHRVADDLTNMGC